MGPSDSRIRASPGPEDLSRYDGLGPRMEDLLRKASRLRADINAIEREWEQQRARMRSADPSQIEKLYDEIMTHEERLHILEGDLKKRILEGDKKRVLYLEKIMKQVVGAAKQIANETEKRAGNDDEEKRKREMQVVFDIIVRAANYIAVSAEAKEKEKVTKGKKQ